MEVFLWIDGVIGTPNRAGIYIRPDLVNHRQLFDIKGGKFQVAQSSSDMQAPAEEDLSILGELKSKFQVHFTAVDFNKIPMSPMGFERIYHSANELRPFKVDSASEINDLCWVNLFDHAFISSSSMPNLMRYIPFGKGLRVTFDLLLGISGIEKAIVREGGIVLVGFCVALIPMQIINKQDKVVQWHFMEHDDRDSCFHAIHTCKLFWEKVPEERLRETSIDKLNGLAYVGWHEKVKISLATRKIVSPPGYSKTARITERWSKSERSIEFGLQYTVPLGPTALVQRGRTSSKSETICRYRTSEQFSARVISLNRSTSFIYDDGRKTAWLCPTIYLILFMSRSYLESELGLDMPAIAFPSTCGDVKGDLAFTKSIRNLESTHLSGDTTSFDSIFKMFHDRYLDAYSNNMVRKKYKESIVGVELQDLMNIGCLSAFPRELKVKNDVLYWSSLIDTDLVVFCSDLGDIIEPVLGEDIGSGNSQSLRCMTCSTPPAGKNILVCPLYL